MFELCAFGLPWDIAFDIDVGKTLSIYKWISSGLVKIDNITQRKARTRLGYVVLKFKNVGAVGGTGGLMRTSGSGQ